MALPPSPAAELYFDLLIDDYACELANQAIQSEAARYPSSREAMRAMVREAYQKGTEAIAPPDFDADVQAVQAANAKEPTHAG